MSALFWDELLHHKRMEYQNKNKKRSAQGGGKFTSLRLNLPDKKNIAFVN